MSSASSRTRQPAFAGIRFLNPGAVTNPRLVDELRERQHLAKETSETHPFCQRLRAWLIATEPELMTYHERDTMIGCAFVVLGMSPDEVNSLSEWLQVIAYWQAQRRIVETVGHCLPDCSQDNIEGGVCKHTCKPCDRQRLSQVIELIGMINRSEVRSE